MKKKITFNQKLERLEEIAGLLDDDTLDIENAIEYYEEGVKLAAECLETLKEAELKISKLQAGLPQQSQDAAEED